MNQEKIGKFISNKRKALGMTQEQFAEKLNVTGKSISRWENGKTMPDISLFSSICNILNIDLEELLSGEDKAKGNDVTINYLKYQKKVFKIKQFVIIFLSLILIISLLLLMFKPYKLDLSETIDYSKIIYNFDDNTRLYSKFENNYIVKYNKIDLGDALKNKIITMNTIISRMKPYNALNDGGTVIYQSKDKKIYLFACNTIEGNHNFYLTGNPNDFDVCSTTYKKDIKINHICLKNKLDNIVLSDSKKEENYNVRLITKGNIPSWDIYKGSKGWYAIIKTDDEIVINDFKKWFSELNNNYKYENIYDNWFIFISNGEDIELEELNDCIK